MTTFVLVHGAWHGGWCYERLRSSLDALGFGSVAMDLPITDGGATFTDHADCVLDAASGVTDDVILVGHSLGSMIVPIVASRRDVRAVVSLCGVIPRFGGMPWDDGPEMAASGVFDPLVQHEDGSSSWPDVESATNAFYNDCTPDDARWAFERLRPNAPRSLWDRPYPLTEWPDAPRVSIVCAEDRAITLEWSRYVAQRLGVGPVVLPGAHSPFLSRPNDLARELARVATD